MPRRKPKKAQAVTTDEIIAPTLLDTSKLDGELRSRGVAVNGPHSQVLVYYYCVYVNGQLARSPWMKLEPGDLIEVYQHDEQDGDVKSEWTVDSPDLIVMHRNCPKPPVDSLFGRGGIQPLASS